MSVKPLSGSIPSLFTTSPLFGKAGGSVETTAAMALFKPAGRTAEAVDEVSFSSQALAALKSGAGMAASRAAIATPAVAAPPLSPSAIPTSRDASGTAASQPRSTATAATAGYGAPPPSDASFPRLGVEGDRPVFDPTRDAEGVSYTRSRTIHALARNEMLRTTFGLPKEIEAGGGLMLTGNIETVINRTMEMDAATAQGKPVSMLEREKIGFPGNPSLPEGTANTSMITLFLPGSRGHGGGQVEILFDDATLSKLAAMPPDAVKAGLVDMMADTDAARAGSAAMNDGTLGMFIAENGDRHPDYASPRARLGLFDPEQEGGGQPMLMIQSRNRPDYVREHADELVDAVMGLLRSLAPSGGGAAAPTAAPTGATATA